MDNRRLNTEEWSQIALSNAQVERIQKRIDSVTAETVSQSEQRPRVRPRVPYLKSMGFVAAGICAAGFIVSGTLGHRAITPQISHDKTKTQANSPDSNPSDSVAAYYKQMLGFQPMLPGHLPGGMKVSNTSMNIERRSDSSFSGFSVNMVDTNYPKMAFSIDEETLAQYNQSSSRVYKVTQKSTIRRDGQSITLYRWPSRYGGGTAVELTKGGVSYAVNAFGNGYPTDELIKILENLNVPEKNKPTMSLVLTNDSVQDAANALSFKAVLPTFIPVGYSERKTDNGSPLGKTTTGPSGVYSEFQVSYGNGKGSIYVVESHFPGQRFKDSIFPNSTLETINGHQVYFYGGTVQHADGAKTALNYEWQDPATDVIFEVSGSDPSEIDKATLQKVVASMLK